MFTHYGLSWSERDVYWGKQKSRGAMVGHAKTQLGRRGAPTRKERDDSQDYRDYIGVYCLYGDGELMYVGEAGLSGKDQTLFKRLNAHRKGPLANRWDKFSWFGREDRAGQCAVHVALAQLEAALIAITNPGSNKQAGTFKDAVQVYQVPHDQAEGGLETKLERIANTLTLLNKLMKKG